MELGSPRAVGSPLLLGRGRNQTLSIPNLKRAAVANGKIVSVRAIPPNELLITAKKVGSTSIQVWDQSGNHQEYIVRVVPEGLFQNSIHGRPNAVVKVSLKIVEVDSKRSREVGLRLPDWIEAVSSGSTSSSSNGLNYVLNWKTARGWFQQLEQAGVAQILSQPELYVELGEEAIFESGGEFPVPTAIENGVNIARKVAWKEFGLRFTLRVQSSDYLNLNSQVEVSYSEPSATGGIEGVPALTKRRIKTRMIPKDGDTAIFSGLIRKSAISGKTGVPFLSQVPIIGILFGAQSVSESETEVVVAMTLSLKTSGDHQKRVNRLEELDDFQ